ncbi:hypothetical protein [Pseudonocardia phyllosphaerae]|uniref:hypothetical protein n=1 Tax=Pseudonocardia phyllosphaerae TaxID=3390502 RepID=UPI00397BE9BA
MTVLRQRVPNLDGRMREDASFRDTVVYVEASAVARAVSNLAAYESIGPYSIRSSGNEDGVFAFSASELRLLGVGVGAFTIVPKH